MQKKTQLKLSVLIGIILCAQTLSAQTVWQGGTDSWNTPANWTAGVPTAADEAQVNNGTAELIVGPAGVANVLTITTAPGDIGTVRVSSNDLDVTNNISVGLGGNGTLLIDSGAQVTASSVSIGVQSPPAFGNLTVTNTGSLLTIGNTLTIGADGGAVVTIEDGGQVFVASSTITTAGLGSAGILNLNGTLGQRGLLNTQALEMGFEVATVNFDGGILQANASNPNFIGFFPPGQLNIMSGGLFLDSQAFDIGTTDNFIGSGILTKLGSGTFTYGGASTNTGGVAVDEGLMTLDGSISGPLNVNNDAAFLQNTTGAIAGQVTVNDTSTAIIGGTITGALTANNAGNLLVAPTGIIGGPVVLNDNSTTTVSGTITGAVTANSAATFLVSATGNIGGPVELNENSATSVGGTITGSVTANNAATFLIVPGGTVGGPVELNDTSSTLVGGTITGAVTANNAATLLVTAGGIIGGPVELNDASNATVDGTLSGAVILNDASIMRLNAAGTITNTAVVNNTANLITNGLVTGLVTTNNQGVLSGTGTVGALDNFGIVAPGDAGIGTLTVTGNHINRASGTHQNELNAAGQTDLLAVGGTSTIEGGTLELIAAPGNYLAGTSYTLITAAGGLTGEFQTVIENLSASYTLGYFPNSLVLFVGGAFDTTGLRGNPRRVAEYINTFPLINGDFATVFSGLDTLNLSELSNALDQMHPAPFQALAITTADTAHMVNDSFMDRLSFLRNTQCGPCDPCSRGGAWISGLADHLRQDRSQGLRRFTATNGGVALGYDKCFCDDLIVGAGAGYSNNNIHWSKSGGHSDGDLYYYGAYATKYNEDFYIDASILGFNGQYKSKRHIEFADIDRRAKSKQCAYGVNPHIGAGLICNYCGIDVIPFAEADYYYFHHNKFREHGARSLNLHVKSYEGSAVRTEAGLRFTKAYDCYCGSFLPYTSISYVGHRYYGRKYKSSFNNQPSNFAVYGTDRCFNQAEFGVGFAYLINDCLAINTSYEIDFGDKRQQQEFNFQLNYRF